MTVDVLAPGEHLAVGAQGNRVAIAEGDGGVGCLCGKVRSWKQEDEKKRGDGEFHRAQFIGGLYYWDDP